MDIPHGEKLPAKNSHPLTDFCQVRQNCPLLQAAREHPSLSGPARALSFLMLGFLGPWPDAYPNSIASKRKSHMGTHSCNYSAHCRDFRCGIQSQLVVLLLERAQKQPKKEKMCWGKSLVHKGGEFMADRGTGDTGEITLLVKRLTFQTGLGPWVRHLLSEDTSTSLYRCSPGAPSAHPLPCPLTHSSNVELLFLSPSHTDFDGSGTIQISCF